MSTALPARRTGLPARRRKETSSSCARCDSADVRQVATVWAQASSDGWVGVVPQLALRCAPPHRPRRWPMLLAGLTALVCGLVFVLEVAPGLGLMPQTHQSYGWAFVIAATVAILLAVRYVERLDDWRVAHQEWLDEWVCMACGAVEA